MAKDNEGIKSVLRVYSPRRVEVASKPRRSVQEMLSHEDLLSTYDPHWWISDTPEITLKPQEPHKDQFGNTKAQKEKIIFKQITKPKEKYRYEPWANGKVERITKPTDNEIKDKEFWEAFKDKDKSGKKMFKYIEKYGDGEKSSKKAPYYQWDLGKGELVDINNEVTESERGRKNELNTKEKKHG